MLKNTLNWRLLTIAFWICCLFGGVSLAAEQPILRIGAMSDNHLEPNKPETHRRTKACFELFRRMNVDVVVDTGDIASRSHISELKFFRACFDEAFAGTDCVPFFCIAGHDYDYVPNTPKNDPNNITNCYRALGMDSANPVAIVKGYRFVNVYQNVPDHKRALENVVAAAVAANEGNRPIFVVNHVPPMNTTTGTEHWSDERVREVFDKYPQIIALTGHIHRSLKWAANIWQGNFTTISLGAHAEYSNPINGEAAILEVFADRIDIRRYEAVSGRELGADDRWSIPLPLDPMHGPYRTELREKMCAVANMPSELKLRYKQSSDGTSGRLKFAAARPLGTAERYLITLESQTDDDNWSAIGTFNWRVPQTIDEPNVQSCPLPPAMLDGGKLHRTTIVAANSHSVTGRSQIATFKAPDCALEMLSAELMAIDHYQRSNNPDAGVFKPDKDGWFDTNGSSAIVVLTKTLTESILKKKTAIFCFDVASDQQGRPNNLSLGRFSANGKRVEMMPGSRIYTLRGHAETNRYVWTLGNGMKPNAGDRFCLIIREGDRARFKVNGVKCFVK